MQTNTRTFVAEASAIMSSDLYMTVAMVMFEAEVPNLNGVRVTEAFIDEVVTHQDKYITLPLVVDRDMLWVGRNLGHKYDPKEDAFDTIIIGAFYKFEKKVEAEKVSLVGYARISKRDQETCNAISKLYAENRLKFSFEIACSSVMQLEDGTMRIDAKEGNYLTGLCIVSQPACPNAVAMQLVAEDNSEEAEEMPNEEIATVEVAEVNEPVQEVTVASTEEDVMSSEPEEVVAEKKCEGPECDPEKKDEKDEKCDETEDAACGKKKCSEEEDAACGKKKCSDEEETAACGKKKCSEDEEETAACGKKKCSDEEETAACGKKKCSDEEDAECKKKKAEVDIASLIETIETLKNEIAEIKVALAERKEAEEKMVETVVAEVNPFVGNDFGLPEKKFSLLDSIETTNFTLI